MLLVSDGLQISTQLMHLSSHSSVFVLRAADTKVIAGVQSSTTVSVSSSEQPSMLSELLNSKWLK